MSEWADWACFKCGLVGHLSAQCPTRLQPRHPPAPPAESGAPESTFIPPPYSAPDRGPGFEPCPPTDAYLAAKAEAGMAGSGALFARLLSAACPWCGAGKLRPCVNPATGQRKQVMHEARYVAVLAPLPARPDLADTAARQVAEARTARIVIDG